MKFILILLVSVRLFAQLNLDTLSANGIMQATPAHQCPHHGVDIKFAMDTSGYAYWLGGCTYGNISSGSHNAEIYRVDIKTGRVDQLYNDTTDPWPGGCQAQTAYDPTRNCIWFGGGGGRGDSNYVKESSKLWRFQCPDGPVTKYSDTTIGDGWFTGARAAYSVFDPAHDLLIALGPYTLHLFYISTRQNFHVPYPFLANGLPISNCEIPSCWDSKRGLLAVTLVQTCWDPRADTGNAAYNVRDMWFFNPSDTTWSHKTPTNIPPIYRCEMTYDSRNDKYLYFGSGWSFFFDGTSCATQIWAYDPASNAWEHMPENGRYYNDVSPTSSTWPANREKGAWGYSEKYNVCLN
jgi:hypothetical protein